MPAAPPPEFAITAESAEWAGKLDSERTHYWQRLRDIWQQPETWHDSYGWNTEWFDRTLMAVEQYVNDLLEHFVQSVRSWRDKLGNTAIP